MTEEDERVSSEMKRGDHRWEGKEGSIWKEEGGPKLAPLRAGLESTLEILVIACLSVPPHSGFPPRELLPAKAEMCEIGNWAKIIPHHSHA